MTKEKFILMLEEKKWYDVAKAVFSDDIKYIERLSNAYFTLEENKKVVYAAKNYLRLLKLKVMEEKWSKS